MRAEFKIIFYYFLSKIVFFEKTKFFRRKSEIYVIKNGDTKFVLQIEILTKNRIFWQKSKFWSKIEILVKNRNFGQQSKFWSKIEILVKNRKFLQQSKFWFKIDIFDQKWNFSQKINIKRTYNPAKNM